MCARLIPSGCAVVRLPAEPLLGSADIQSLADLGNSYEVGADHAPCAHNEGCHPPTRGRDTRADCAAVAHLDAAGGAAEKTIRHLVLVTRPMALA